MPKEADFVFDLRFLQNPYFVENLRPMSGKDKLVQDFIFANETARQYQEKIHDFCSFVLPCMEAEGRYRVSIALGCTGGRHRSVAFAENLYAFLRDKEFPVSLEHRHLELG